MSAVWSKLFASHISLLAVACNTSSTTAPAAAAGSANPLTLAPGQVAPDVELVLHDFRRLRLSSLKGKHVVLYFYPMDDTPGCRLQAQSFRDHASSLAEKNVIVFGVSTQGAESHQAFIDKERLTFDLVVDDGTVAAAFGVPLRARFAARQTILIDPQGNIQRIWREVSPENHAAHVLAAIDR